CLALLLATLAPALASLLELAVALEPDLLLAPCELVRRRDVADRAVQADRVVVLDERADDLARLLEGRRRLGPDRGHLERPVPPLDLPVGLRVVRRGADVGHARQADEDLEVARDELRAVVRDDARTRIRVLLQRPLHDGLDIDLLHR